MLTLQVFESNSKKFNLTVLNFFLTSTRTKLDSNFELTSFEQELTRTNIGSKKAFCGIQSQRILKNLENVTTFRMFPTKDIMTSTQIQKENIEPLLWSYR
jgi:hypothetical protein